MKGRDAKQNQRKQWESVSVSGSYVVGWLVGMRACFALLVRGSIIINITMKRREKEWEIRDRRKLKGERETHPSMCSGSLRMCVSVSVYASQHDVLNI